MEWSIIYKIYSGDGGTLDENRVRGKPLPRRVFSRYEEVEGSSNLFFRVHESNHLS